VSLINNHSTQQSRPKRRSKNWVAAPLFYVAFCCFPGLSYAEIHGTITGTTNYVYRMYSKSFDKPALQGNLDYQHSSGFFTGVSISSFHIGKSEVNENFSFPGSAQAEIIPYAGWTFKLADDWRMDLQYSRYFYNAKIYGFAAEYNEFYAFLHYKELVTAQVSASDDFYSLGGAAYFFELTGRYPITDYLEFSSSVGYSRTHEVTKSDYRYWNAGLTARYKFIAFDLRYHDSREEQFDLGFIPPDHPESIKATAVFSISVGF
jgi:uncharacterized protein (TIGR02001 family)